MNTVPLIGICRHRLVSDGQGVTTLVAFHDCPLRCKYCLNMQCLQADGVWKQMSVQEIQDEVMVDNLYFQATGGGVTFGGGEPLLRSREIAVFCQLCPAEWHIYMETSLNVPLQAVEAVAPFIDHYYIDVKDMNPDIYHRYTSRDNRHVLENLSWLASHDYCQKNDSSEDRSGMASGVHTCGSRCGIGYCRSHHTLQPRQDSNERPTG